MSASAIVTSPTGDPARAGDAPIAIVGIGCRYPEVDGPGDLWRLLLDGRCVVTDVPASRWDQHGVFDAEKPIPRRGAFLRDVRSFDAQFFKIAPREAEQMDPQQRLTLEVAWEALEDAGCDPGRSGGERTGVYMGAIWHDYEIAHRHVGTSHTPHSAVGQSLDVIAARVSYAFGFQGPSLVVNTSCSSSLVALHLACQAIRMGECRSALVGGTNIMLTPDVMVGLTRFGGLAPDGVSKAFSAAADGFGRGEGVAMVVLRPLADALADGDRIYCVIRATGVNNDGGGRQLTSPSAAGQAKLLRELYATAGIDPLRVAYVETHGTGTPAGDPVEAGALGEVLGHGRDRARPLRIGSIKTNIGHQEGGAGIAGVIKVALSLFHGQIPASLHSQPLNPNIDFEALGLEVQRAPGPWGVEDGPALAGVSSFGWGGTNAHAILQAAPPAALQDRARSSAGARPERVVLVSAATAASLRRRAADLAAVLAARPDALDAISATLAARRAHLAHRLAVVGPGPEMTDALARFASSGELADQGEVHGPLVLAGEAASTGRKVVFVFPGQGSQWRAMGKRLLEQEPVFAAAIERASTALRAFVGWSLERVLSDPSDEAWLAQVEIVQCALWAMQVALAELWRSWGVEPHAVVGHSMGEVAAACVAGALSLSDGARIIATRSALARRRSGGGAMLHVALSEDQARAALDSYADLVSVAVCSSPKSTVLSGDRTALAKIEQRLTAQDVLCRPVRVDYASHSPQMDVLLDELRELLAPIAPRAAAVAMHSTVRGRPVQGTELGPDYWAHNLRDPVRFAEVIQGLARDGHTIFVEVSPHPILVPSIEENLHALELDGRVVGTLRREQAERRDMLARMCELQIAGAAIQWSASDLIPTAEAIDLPGYPWAREPYWLAEPGRRALARGGRHAFIRDSRPVASPGRSTVVQARLAVSETPFLHDHVVLDAIVFPAAGHIDLVLAAAREVYPERCWTIEDLRFDVALTLGTEDARAVQVVLDEAGPGLLRFSVASAIEGDEASGWTRHARGRLRSDRDAPPIRPSARPEHLTPVAAPAYHEALRASGLRYGPAFRGATELRVGAGYAEGIVEAPDGLRAQLGMYGVHPAMLDAALQIALAAAPDVAGAARVPVRIARVQLHRTWPERVHVIARRASSADEELAIEVVVRDPAGDTVLDLEGLELAALAATPARAPEDELFIETVWQPAPRPSPGTSPATPPEPGRWAIVDFGDSGDELAQQLTHAGQSAVLAVHTPGRASEDLGDRCRLDATRAEDVGRWVAELAARGDDALRGVVVLGAFREVPQSEPDWALAETLVAVVARMTAALGALEGAARPRLVLITTGAQDQACARPEWAAVWGAGRVVEMERPEIPCLRIDLEAGWTSLDEVTRDLLGALDESEIAYRGGARLAARLSRTAWGPERALAVRRQARIAAGRTAYHLETVTPGSIENLSLCATGAAELPDDQIRVAIDHAALNFIDLMKVLGIYPGLAPELARIGEEGAGRVVAKGRAAVTDLAVGDEVVVTPFHAFQSIVDVRTADVIRKPAALSAEQAAAYPCAVMTAWYGLHHLARIRRGERVLVHAGTGGLGLAAIDIARRAGLEVYATAGSADKRAYLRALGVEHVYDSRSSEFATQIRRLTRGQGVDVVLNSLQGELMDTSVGLLRFGGRFLEVGKRDIYSEASLPLHHFRKAIAFFAIDLGTLHVQQPERYRQLLEEVTDELAAGRLSPPVVRGFPASRVREAFELMARAEHVGKLVVDMTAVTDVAAQALPGGRARADGVYLISGGLGALGRAAGEWLAGRGAGRIVLIGRGEPTAESQASLTRMRALGARVDTVACDIAAWPALSEALRPVLDGQTVRGVIHAAGVLDDATLANLTGTQIERVFRPKTRGAWNLHRLTAAMPLDFFALYSSVASLFGSAGQATYAAANACLDALAQHRLHRGLPATAINWGPVTGVGLAARSAARGERLASRGLMGITVDDVTRTLERVLVDGWPRIGIARLDAVQWRQAYPAAADWPRWSALLPAAGANPQPRAELRARLEAGAPGERRDLLESAIRTLLSQVLRLTEDRVPRTTPFGNLGLDSLLGLELRNQLERTLGLAISVTTLWRYPTLERLSGALLERTGLSAVPPPSPEPKPRRRPVPVIEAPVPDTGGDLMAELEAEIALGAMQVSTGSES